MSKAVILLSGGLDSATVAAIAKKDHYQLHALSFSYQQRHQIELEFAQKLVKFFGITEHKIAHIDLGIFGGSALTDSSISVPKDLNTNNSRSKIPVTYVPARNTIFLAYALAYAETINAVDIFIGVNALDYSGYPDCRPDFITAFTKMANLATKSGSDGARYRIHTPLINLTKQEIIKLGSELGVDYSLTHSCYDPIIKNTTIYGCGACDSCVLRLKGFKENHLKDPYQYLN